MNASNESGLAITGIGITSAIGQGKSAFFSALMAGQHKFDRLAREGRQLPPDAQTGELAAAPFLGAEIGTLVLPSRISPAQLRTLSWSAQVAVATLDEAWQEAGLDDFDKERIGLIVGGSNFQQREIMQHVAQYREKLAFIRPTYAMNFMDTDLTAYCSELFGIRGPCFTLGGASASGQLAVIQAAEAVKSGQVDICIAVGALMDLSYWECQAFRAIGAMGSSKFADRPDLAARPFDLERDGFIYGESCGAVVIESSRLRSNKFAYGLLKGWGINMDANRNPNPSVTGEINAIHKALTQAGLIPQDIDYINPHGTGSPLGDTTELSALKEVGLTHAYINTTKSIIGHGLSAAGIVELIALLLQMKHEKLHPSRNLGNPIMPDFNWVRTAESYAMKCGLNLSMGFGGMNTAVCVERIQE